MFSAVGYFIMGPYCNLHYCDDLFRCYLGAELIKSEGSESVLKSLWHHSDAVLCCSLKVSA